MIAVGILVVGCIAGALLISKQRSAEKARTQQADAAGAATGRDKDSSSRNNEGPVPDATEIPDMVITTPAFTPAPMLTVTPGPGVDTPAPAQSPAAAEGSNKPALLSWLNALHTPAPAAAALSSPAVTPGTTARPAAAVTPQSAGVGATADAKSRTKGSPRHSEINLGEEFFSKTGPKSTDRVAAVMEKLEAQKATATPNTSEPAETPGTDSVPLFNVDDSNFQTEVLAYSETLVLLGFYSPKVANSNSIAPVLLELAQQPDPRVKVGIVNIDEAKGLRQRFLVEAVPTSILIKNGQEFARFGPEISVPAVNQALQRAAIKNLPHVDRPR